MTNKEALKILTDIIDDSGIQRIDKPLITRNVYDGQLQFVLDAIKKAAEL